VVAGVVEAQRNGGMGVVFVLEGGRVVLFVVEAVHLS